MAAFLRPGTGGGVVFCAAAILLFSCASPGPEPAARLRPVPTPEAAYRDGVAYLVRSQNRDGSWGSFESARPGEIYLGTVSSFRAFGTAASALACTALREPSKTDPAAAKALDRGLKWLLASPPASRATGDTFYNNWTHLYMIQSLAEFYADPRYRPLRTRIREVYDRELRSLATYQSADGGWGYYDFGYNMRRPSGNDSTSFMTGATLVALHDARAAGLPVPDGMVAGALKCLSSLRLPNGAYIYGQYAKRWPEAGFNRPKGSLGRSQPCNLGLHLHGLASADDLRRGVDILFAEHHFIWIGRCRPYPHEAWYSTAGYYFFFGHYYAARAIERLPAADRERYAAAMRDALPPLQDPDGAWWDFPLYGYHKVYGTAFALMSLDRCKREEIPNPKTQIPNKSQ